ncbi:hypothetical protein J437_LFUL015246 [Ladona fulva]|uniref:Uncharacterized protein n=1 Tax=Ladona fulva TaxID=123851 RepID=A0A8K0KIJ2_LADFU|nr:hypothetical protein J437_LFUL015246 [Ladona fulva]
MNISNKYSLGCYIKVGQCSIISFKVVDEPRTERPSPSTTDDNLARVCVLLYSGQWKSVRIIVETLNIPETIVYELVTDKLDMRKVFAKLVPMPLMDDQKNHRMTVLTTTTVVPLITFSSLYIFLLECSDESWGV